LNTLYLLSCVSKKKPREELRGFTVLHPASELYCSDWFLKAKGYVTQDRQIDLEGDQRRWGILSALYGFLEPTDLIAPYDLTLKSMTKAERFYWAKKVMTRLAKFIPANNIYRVVFFAGVDYRNPLTGLLMELFGEHFTEAPLSKMGIGEQLSFFKKHTKDKAP